jgi:predicted O-methyltransferase YrrM
LNSIINQKAWSTGRYFDFLLHSGNRYQVHSPYLYTMIEEVIRSDKHEAGFERIEQIRQECLKGNEIIQKTDYGESGKNYPGRAYPISVSKIARTSLSTPKYARRLYRLVQFMNAGKILEIGTSLGITTAYLALANPGSRIITLEGCPELSLKAREHFHRLGIHNIDLIEGRFEDTLSKALMQLGTVDLVYIDGNHHKDAMIDYFEQCSHHSGNETVMIFDDIHSSSGMEEAWEIIRKKAEVQVSLDLFSTGWVLFRKESSKEHFRLRYI